MFKSELSELDGSKDVLGSSKKSFYTKLTCISSRISVDQGSTEEESNPKTLLFYVLSSLFSTCLKS